MKVSVSRVVYNAPTNRVYSVNVDGRKLKTQKEVEESLGLVFDNFSCDYVIERLREKGYDVREYEMDVS